MHPIVVVALLLLPAALSAQLSIPVRIGRVPVHATIGARGITVGSGRIYARIPYPDTRTAGRTTTSGRTSSGGTATRTSGGASSGGGGRVATRASASRVAASVLNTADDFQGVRYTWGGESASEGFDCSGFTQFVFSEHGVRIPRTSREQSRVGDGVSLSVSALMPGDLMFFDASGNDGVVDHVGIYAGDNRMIHSSSSGDGVRYDNLTTQRGQFFVTRMVAARRVIGSSGTSYASAQGPSVFGWLAKAFKGSKANVQFDPPDWAPKPATR